MIQNVQIKSKDPTAGLYDVFFDGVQVTDKIDMLSFFAEPGKTPHMIITAPFLNLEVDGIPANVDFYKSD